MDMKVEVSSTHDGWTKFHFSEEVPDIRDATEVYGEHTIHVVFRPDIKRRISESDNPIDMAEQFRSETRDAFSMVRILND